MNLHIGDDGRSPLAAIVTTLFVICAFIAVVLRLVTRKVIKSVLASRRLCNSCGHGKIYGDTDIKRC